AVGRRAPAHRRRPRAADAAAIAAARRAAGLARRRAQGRDPALSRTATRRFEIADDLCQSRRRRGRAHRHARGADRGRARHSVGRRGGVGNRVVGWAKARNARRAHAGHWWCARFALRTLRPTRECGDAFETATVAWRERAWPPFSRGASAALSSPAAWR